MLELSRCKICQRVERHNFGRACIQVCIIYLPLLLLFKFRSKSINALQTAREIFCEPHFIFPEPGHRVSLISRILIHKWYYVFSRFLRTIYIPRLYCSCFVSLPHFEGGSYSLSLYLSVNIIIFPDEI